MIPRGPRERLPFGAAPEEAESELAAELFGALGGAEPGGGDAGVPDPSPLEELRRAIRNAQRSRGRTGASETGSCEVPNEASREPANARDRERERWIRRTRALPADAARAAEHGVSGARTTRRIAAWLRAERELGRVLRIEWAAVMRRAARLRCELEPFAARHAPLGPAVDRRRWARTARRTARRLARDASALPELARLRGLLASEPCAWPSAVVLAREAAGARPCDAARLLLARAHLACGAPAAAQEVLGELLRRDPRPGLRRRAFDLLARAHEERGSDRLALALFEAAAEEPGCGPGPRVSSLFLALALGDTRAAARAAARLDAAPGPAPDEPRFRRALERLRARAAAMYTVPWSPPGATATLFHALSRSGSRSAAVCRAVR